MLTQDWMMRQIETTLLSLAKFIFHKDTTDYEASGLAQDQAVDDGALQLSALVEEGRFSQGEDLLFDLLEDGSQRALELAVDFYARLNERSDAQLQAGGFSRGEIQDGVQDTMDQYGVVLP